VQLAENQLSCDTPLFGVAANEYARTHAAFGIRFAGSRYLDVGSVDDYAIAESFLSDNDTIR
jgi:hypothetical protein